VVVKSTSHRTWYFGGQSTNVSLIHMSVKTFYVGPSYKIKKGKKCNRSSKWSHYIGRKWRHPSDDVILNQSNGSI
jgi:hypothetical protein